MNNSKKNKSVISKEQSVKFSITYQSPYRHLFILTFSVFVCELAVMIILSSLPSFPILLEAFFDSILLVFFLSPMLYLFLLRPLVQNINQCKLVEKDLIMSESRLQHLLTASPAVIYSSKASGDYGATFISENIKEQMGFEPHEFIDNPEFWSKNIHSNDSPRVFKELSRLFEHNYHSLEYRFKGKDGNYRWMHDELRLIRDNEGNPIEIVGCRIDITDRKQAEEMLRESEERFRTAFNNAASGIALIANDGYFMKVNQTLCRILGYSEEELLDKTWIEITSPDDLDGCFDWLKRVKAGEQDAYEKRFIHKLGHPVWVMVSSSLVRDLQGRIRYYISLFQDIMSRKQAEEALRESEEKYRLLVKNLTSIVYIGYKDWSVEFFDEKIELLTGYTANEFNSKKMKWVDIIIEEDIETVREIFIQALKTDKSYVREYRLKSKTGSLHWIEERGQIVCDNSGEIEYVNGTFFDKTETKKLEAQLQQAQKLESVGILAGGIAHDFNNLLSIIMGNISMTKDDVKPEYGVTDFLNEAEEASLRAQELTSQLITFSKGGAPVKKIGSIGDLVKNTTNFSISDSNVQCNFSIPQTLWLAEFDEGQMKHAINNLIINAVESMPDGGLIEVQAENFIFSSEIVAKSSPLSEGKYVKISIRDQGIGIPEEHLSMIFDPYFSTKEMGTQKGMGLGLATTYSIINRHDGHITIESEVGVGTTFTLYLPAHEKDVRELESIEIPKPEKPEIRTGRVLLMDDEKSIRKVTKQMLIRLGCDPDFAKDGKEAIELYKEAIESGNSFEVVILDLTIKEGMGGVDAIKKLKEIDPQVRAIVSSGYSNDPAMTDFRKYGFIGALAKPYTKKDLSDTLDKITKGKS